MHLAKHAEALPCHRRLLAEPPTTIVTIKNVTIMSADYAASAGAPDCPWCLQDLAPDCFRKGAGISRPPTAGCPGHATQLQVGLCFDSVLVCCGNSKQD